jgi:hypothetical protein
MISKGDKDNGLITEVTTITPEVAAKWLASANANNRSLSEKKVKRIASSISKGLWRLTHQGIAFYEDDRLADGQHRLAAIVMAGVPVQVMVTYGLPTSVNDSIDKGLARTLKDNMDFIGVKLTRNQLAAYRCLYAEYDRQLNNAETWSAQTLYVETSEFSAFQVKHHTAIDFAMSVKLQPKIAISQVYAAVAAASLTENKVRLEEFLQVLVSGVATVQEDSAAIRLREYLFTNTLDRGFPGKFDTYVRACAAVTAFLEHRGLSKLYARREALFPVLTK